jgi:hypothetical protein
MLTHHELRLHVIKVDEVGRDEAMARMGHPVRDLLDGEVERFLKFGDRPERPLRHLFKQPSRRRRIRHRRPLRRRRRCPKSADLVSSPRLVAVDSLIAVSIEWK